MKIVSRINHSKLFKLLSINIIITKNGLYEYFIYESRI